MMHYKNFTIILIFYLIKCLYSLPRFTAINILEMEKKKENLGLIYINSKNVSHNLFMEEFSNYLQLNPLDKYNFGYLDIEDDKKILKYFKIKNVIDIGILIYRFDNEIYYIKEGLNNLNEIKNIFEQINNKKLNWSSNSIIERMLYLITGKRYGKNAHVWFAYGIFGFSFLLFIFVNYLAKKEEKELNLKKKKE